MTSSPPSSTLRKTLKTSLAWGLGLGLLAWMAQHVPLDQALSALARPANWVWALTLAGLLGSYALRAARLQVVLDLDSHHRAPHRWLGLRTDALRVILMHNAAVNLLPMRAGELSFPWLASRELNHPVSRAVACLLWMRLQDLTVLCLLGALFWPGVSLPWRLAGLLTLALGWWALTRLLGTLLARGPHTNPATASPAAGAGWRAHLHKLRDAMLEPAHHRPAAWLLTLANWALKLAAGATLLAAISTAPWPQAWAGALGGELAAIVPLQGPAGFGTYEAGVWAGMATGLPLGSVALQQAIPAALALHVCFLVCAVVAGLLALLLSRLHTRAGPP